MARQNADRPVIPLEGNIYFLSGDRASQTLSNCFPQSRIYKEITDIIDADSEYICFDATIIKSVPTPALMALLLVTNVSIKTAGWSSVLPKDKPRVFVNLDDGDLTFRELVIKYHPDWEGDEVRFLENGVTEIYTTTVRL